MSEDTIILFISW